MEKVVVQVEPIAVSVETAAAMFDWKIATFRRHRKRLGVDFLPGSDRLLVDDLRKAASRWSAAGSPTGDEIDANPRLIESRDPFDEGTSAHG